MPPRKPLRTLADDDLVRLLSRGNPDALGELRARYRAVAYEVAYRYVADPEDAEAAVAQAFERARDLAATLSAALPSVAVWLLELTRLAVFSRLGASDPEVRF